MRGVVRGLLLLGLIAGCRDAQGPPGPAAGIEAPDSLVVLEGDSARVTGFLVDGAGQRIAPVAWVSADTVVVQVSADGFVHFGQPGYTRLLALGGGFTREVPVRSSASFADVIPNGSFNDVPWCAIGTRGGAWCFWQYIAYAPRGDSLFRLQTPDNRPLTMLTLHSAHECGLLEGGQPACWRLYDAHLLGDPSVRADVPIDSPVTPVIPAPLTSMSASFQHTCGVISGGAAWCWGSPASGQLGTGDTLPGAARPPAPVAGTHHFTAIASGVAHTCALDAAGAAWCWGSNRYAQLGSGGVSPGFADAAGAPGAVAGGHTFTMLTAGGYQTCGLEADSTAWCWGAVSDTSGPSCAGIRCASVPRQVSSALHFASVSAAGDLSDPLACGLTAAGAAFCWGRNAFGEVGDATTSRRISPTAVPIGALRRLRAGAYGACGILMNGAAWCWGGGFGAVPRKLPFQS